MMSLVPSLSTITTFYFLGRFLRFREGRFGCCYVPPSVNVPVDKEVSSVSQKDNEVKDSLEVDDASKCVENLDAEVLNIDAYKEVAVECQATILNRRIGMMLTVLNRQLNYGGRLCPSNASRLH
ncbi:hypothetical protein LWI28_016362 [Acer negundo]|uniref:Uncharacterized protein n=1 Tax=Acer negundo TaxID=4023 RepID=A0AAD5J6C4_ACENE|nr:hypothetical protein LWI28_016362 [Acer negundo]